MNKKDKRKVCETVVMEGFHYAFRHYSNFEEIKSKKFHQLREVYVKAAKELEEFIGLEDE